MWLVGIIVYIIIGFIFGTTMNLLYVSEQNINDDNNSVGIIIFLLCMLFWPIILPVVIFNTIFNKE